MARGVYRYGKNDFEYAAVDYDGSGQVMRMSRDRYEERQIDPEFALLPTQSEHESKQKAKK